MSHSFKERQSVEITTEAYGSVHNKIPFTRIAKTTAKEPFITGNCRFNILGCFRGYGTVKGFDKSGMAVIPPYFFLSFSFDFAPNIYRSMESVSPEVEHAIVTWVSMRASC